MYPQHLLNFVVLAEIISSFAETEPLEPKLFGDLEPEPKINFNKHLSCEDARKKKLLV